MKIQFEHITKSYSSIVLDDISYRLESGKLYVIKGVSGSGKTTLLHILSGIETDYQGEIKDEHGNRLTPKQLRAQCSFISQYSLLLSNLTIMENLQLIDNDADKIQNLAKEYHIEDQLASYPNQLSGGERQRVSCVRAMLSSPGILFADEPTASLDHENSQNIANLLREMADQGMIIVVATHEHYFDSLACEVIQLKNGRFCCEEKPQIESDTKQEEREDIQSQNNTQKKYPLHIVIKRYAESLRFRKLIGYIIMLLMLYTIIFLGVNTEKLLIAFMGHRFPINSFQLNMDEYQRSSLRDNFIPYYNYTAQDGEVTALYLSEYDDSVLRVDGMLLYGTFPNAPDEIIVSYDYAQEVCPEQDDLGCRIQFAGKSFVISGVLRPFQDDSLGNGFSFLQIYNSDAYYFHKYGKNVYIPYSTLMTFGTKNPSEKIRVHYPGLFQDTSNVDTLRQEVGFGGPINPFDDVILEIDFFAKWIAAGLVALFLVCFGISCVFMSAQIGVELFYRKREIGYLQIFGISKKRMSLYIVIGYSLRIILASIISFCLIFLGLVVIQCMIDIDTLFTALCCLLVTLAVVLIYLLMVIHDKHKFLKQPIIKLIT